MKKSLLVAGVIAWCGLAVLWTALMAATPGCGFATGAGLVWCVTSGVWLGVVMAAK
jgi:hypothetical protein